MTEILNLIHEFEAATIPNSSFHHREHLIVALYYAAHNDPAESLRKMRTGLQRLLAANNKPPTAYKEELTALWMNRAHTFLASRQATFSLETTAEWLQHAAKFPR
jgi:hypothetical protein